MGEGADEQDGNLSPLQALVEDRMKELGLGRSDLARGMGYSNVSKGCRRVDELLDDDLLLAVRLRNELAHGLGLDVETVDRAIEATAARRRAQHWQEYRASFVPHAVALCERDKPSFMLVFGRAVGQRWMRFPDDLSPVEYTQWAFDWLPAEVRGVRQDDGVRRQLHALRRSGVRQARECGAYPGESAPAPSPRPVPPKGAAVICQDRDESGASRATVGRSQACRPAETCSVAATVRD